ncbi:hypothetical protein RUND412_008346 [Rhizina undulata]
MAERYNRPRSNSFHSDSSDDLRKGYFTPEDSTTNADLDFSVMGLEDDEIVIAVMGVTGSGKSNFISKLTGGAFSPVVGHGLASCTQSVHAFPAIYNRRRYRFIDTPGFNDTNISDAQILKELSVWLEQVYRFKTHLSGILYLQRITENRVSGSTLKSLEVFKALVGESSMPNVILTTTHWDHIDEPTGFQREAELSANPKFWKELLDAGATTARFGNSQADAWDIVSRLTFKTPTVLTVQRELVDENKMLSETAACIRLQGNLEQLEAARRKELELIQKQLKEALDNKDRENERILMQERTEFLRQLQSIQEQQNELHENQTRILKSQVDALTMQVQQLQEKDGIWGVLESVTGMVGGILEAVPALRVGLHAFQHGSSHGQARGGGLGGLFGGGRA